jgi:monofunctional biosynthetic peptidoglycan transglycosylase
VYLSLPDVRALRTKNPGTTAFMELRAEEARARGAKPRWEQRWVGYDQISPNLRRAVLVAEDSAFWQHDGVDLEQLKESIEINLERGQFVRGASTITQQLAKNLYLSREKSLSRKFKEAIITCKLERHLSKKRILELYLNAIEWSPGVHGVGEASQHYFRKSPTDLDFFESILLAAIIPSPRLYNPLRYPDRALDRYRIVVWLMYRSKLITLEQYNIAYAIQFRVDPSQDTIIISPR